MNPLRESDMNRPLTVDELDHFDELLREENHDRSAREVQLDKAYAEIKDYLAHVA